jgi:hypothetical protein
MFIKIKLPLAVELVTFRDLLNNQHVAQLQLPLHKLK